MFPTTHGLFSGALSASSDLTIDSISGSTSSTVLVSETTLESTSDGMQPTYTASGFTPDDFSWSFINTTPAGVTSRSFDNPNIEVPTITVIADADNPSSTYTHEIELVATDTGAGIQRTATFTFQTSHMVSLGISTGSSSINRHTGNVGEMVVADAGIFVSLHTDVANRLDADYGAGNWYYEYSDEWVGTTPPPRSKFAPNGSTDWATAEEPYITQASSVEQLLEAEIQSTNQDYQRSRKATITDASGNSLTINGYIIETGTYSQNFPFGPV